MLFAVDVAGGLVEITVKLRLFLGAKLAVVLPEAPFLALDSGFLTLKLCPLLRRKLAAFYPLAYPLLLEPLSFPDFSGLSKERLGQRYSDEGPVMITPTNLFIPSLPSV